MIPSIRSALNVRQNESADNPGLALSKYLTDTDDDHQKAKELLQQAMNSAANDAYRKAFNRWRQTLNEMKALLANLELSGPMAIGLGNESPMEVGFTTHFTYGMPIIPGSALKGMCRRSAQLLLAGNLITQSQFEALFGTQDLASQFIFWDAWYDPDTVGSKPFHRDVVTVHHPKYYQNNGKTDWPTDFDDPNPIPFLCVRPKAGFLFAISAPNEQWGEFASELLKWSLSNLGIGGKTNAGYGYFQSIQQGGQNATALSKENERWADVTLVWNPGQKEITATQNKLKAYVKGDAVENILKELPSDVQERFQKKKSLKADTEVERRGNQITILRIIPKS